MAAATGGEALDVAQVLEDVAAQQHALGYDVKEQSANLESAGHPAAGIVYSYTMVDRNNTPVSVIAHQYFVSSPDALWILTYTLHAEGAAELESRVKRSASSFRLR